MSLKTQLRIAIVALVTLMVVAQSLVSLRLVAEGTFRHGLNQAQSMAIQVRSLVSSRLRERLAQEAPAPDQIHSVAQSIVDNDPAFAEILRDAVASQNVVVELMICDQDGRILATSLPTPRQTYTSLQRFEDWEKKPLWDRLIEVFSQSEDYVTVAPIAFQDASQVLVSVRVVVSTILIKNAIETQVVDLGWILFLTLLVSTALAYLFSNVVLRDLDSLSHRIERMAIGEFTPDLRHSKKEGKEIAAMQSKLDVLSQQFRGARDDVAQLRSNIERLLAGLEEAVLLFDAEHRLIRASRSVQPLLGMAPDQIVGQSLTDLFPATTVLGGLLREAIEHQHPIRDAVAVADRPDGHARVLVNVELLESYPEPGRFSLLLTLRDAETRRQIRSQLDISTRLAAISRLTGSVAHEIKNPLNAIALHLEILKSRMTEQTDVQNTVDVIGGEIARLDRVVKTFLDFTRPVEVRMKEVNLVELCRQVAALVWPQAERMHVSVQLESQPQSAMIRGDDDLLKQALLNVINNGIEAMKLGGRLVIRVDRERDDVVVNISDEGGGIPEELREKIFNLYFSTKEKGSGIGLAMTFRIVQLHNATIDFTTQTGEGTTFHLRFPAVDDSPGEEAAVKSSTILEPASPEGIGR